MAKQYTEEELERIARSREKRRSAGKTVVIVILSALVAVLVGVLASMVYLMTQIQQGKNVSFSVPFLNQKLEYSVDEEEVTDSAAASAEAAAESAAGGAEEAAAETQSAVSQPAGSESAASGTEGTSSAAESAAGAAPDAETAAIKEVAADTLPVPASKEEALQFAEGYAVQYDYDSAVAVIQSFAGYESDSDLTSAIDSYTAQKAACCVVDVQRVPHIFFHSLLNDDRGLRKDVVGEQRAWKNDTAMVTADEFDNVIQQMYEAGYVLISLDDMCIKTQNSDGTVSIRPSDQVLLPEGKKAFVLSVDDLSYYHSYGIGTQGYATKLVLDENGAVKCEYTNESGETLIGDYDVVPRMDTFIHEHPEFAYHNARGTVALTGYNGVFGYRTNDYYKDINHPKLDKDQVQWLKDHPDFNFDEDVASAKAIADAMKKEGWTFASHTYGHWNASSHTAAELKTDNERWMTCNHEIIGDIDKIIFAFGGDIGTAHGYTADNDKFQYFKSQGYNIFCNVDGHAGWTEFGENYMRTGRIPIDGFSLYQAMTETGGSHATYSASYEVLGIHDIDKFFNKNRIVPIETE